MYVNTFIKTITADGVQVTTASARVRHIVFQANSANAGQCMIGSLSGTSATGVQLNARETFSISDPYEKIDPSQFYLFGTASDWVRVFTITGG